MTAATGSSPGFLTGPRRSRATTCSGRVRGRGDDSDRRPPGRAAPVGRLMFFPEPPSDAEKGSYAWRSLPLLATALAISALCLIVAQVWFEVRYAHVLPFAVALFAYTVAYFVYQLVSLPVNFAGRSFDLAAHNSLHCDVAPAPLPVGRHLPAHLRRADRRLAQYLDRCFRACAGVPWRGLRFRTGRRPEPGSQGAGTGLRVHLRAPSGYPQPQEGGQPQLRLRAHARRAHRDLRR